MNIDNVAMEFIGEGVSTVQVQAVGKDKTGRKVLTTYVIDYYPDSFEKPYRYSVSSKPLRFFDYDGVN